MTNTTIPAGAEGRPRERHTGPSHIRGLWQDKAYRIFCYVLSTIWVSFTIFPLVWLLGSTFKDSVDVMKMPPDILPRIPSLYTVQLDYADVNLSGAELERVIREDLALAVWRVPDYLAAIHLGAMRAEAYLDGRKVAETFLPTHTFTYYRGRLWVTQRISDRLVRRNVDQALFPAKLKMDLDGSLAAKPAGQPNAETAQIAELFGTEIQPTGQLIQVAERRYFPAIFNNFIAAWRAPDRLYKGMTFAGYMVNGLRITIADILLQWVVSGMAAYALSRILSPKWSRVWTIYFLITMMVPGIATLIPLYEMVGKMGLHDRLLGVIIPSIPGAFTIYLFKGFFDALPGEIFDAARIDGASEFKVFFRIVAPMSKNVFTVIGLLTFLGSWSNFFWPYLVLRSPKVWTFTIAIYMAMGGSGAAGAQYGSAMASAVMAALPTILIFAVFSRTIQQGLVWSGLKG